jgi:hypothetical protein
MLGTHSAKCIYSPLKAVSEMLLISKPNTMKNDEK